MDIQTLLARSTHFLNGTFQRDEEAIRELQTLLRSHNERYYIHSDPVISDREYDSLFRLLQDIERELGIYDPTSPTARIEVLLSRQFEK